MLQPKRTKFRKKQKGRVKGIAQRGHTISFGSFGLKALEPGLDHESSNRSRSYCGNKGNEA